MEKHLKRRFVLSAAEVRQAIVYWMRTGNDQPMPDDIKKIEIKIFDNNGGAVVECEDLSHI